MQIFLFTGIDFKNIPPSEPEFVEKVKRASYIAKIIKNADRNLIELPDPTNHGWVFADGEYGINFFSGLQFPSSLNEFCSEYVKGHDEEESDQDASDRDERFEDYDYEDDSDESDSADVSASSDITE